MSAAGGRGLALLVLSLAVVIDAMKVFTLALVAPGMAAEYGLSSPAHPHGGPPIALLPLVAITGTVTGSFGWGWLGDRIGRRASIILAGLLFMTTAICGAMARKTHRPPSGRPRAAGLMVCEGGAGRRASWHAGWDSSAVGQRPQDSWPFVSCRPPDKIREPRGAA